MNNLIYQKRQHEYMDERKQLLDKESKCRFCQKQGFLFWDKICGDYELSQQEKRLNEKMDEIRAAERTASYKDNKTYPAAMPFYSIKEKIQSSPLFEVFRQMPKGALLHVHSSAALSSEGFRELLLEWEAQHPAQNNIKESPPQALYVLWNEPLPVHWTKGTLFYQWFLNSYKGKDLAELLASCVPLNQVIADSAFWDGLMFTSRINTESYRWTELNAMFSRTSGLLEDKDFYRKYHRRFFQECIDDKIDYVEMRSGLASLHRDTPNALFQSVLAHPDYDWKNHFYFEEMNAPDGIQDTQFMDILQEELEEVQKSREGKNFNLRLILNARRDLDPSKPKEYAKLMDKLNSAILYHCGTNYKKYHDFVIGFDFVSEEDQGYPTAAYSEFIYGTAAQINYEDPQETDNWKMRFEENQIALNRPRIEQIDFYLHDGESTWSSNSNVIDACIASRYRIGHGFNLINHPAVTDTLTFGCYGSQAYFPILEICPVSNQLLMYYPDLRCHPALALMRQGVQCVICSDDPQMFGNGGLSYDFWMAYMGFGIDLLDIKRLVFNAHFAKSNYQKTTADEVFKRQWDDFVDQALNILRLLIKNV